MFHWQNNFYFGRCDDGSVRLVKFDSPRGLSAVYKHGSDGITRETQHPDADGEFVSVNVVLDVRIPAEHWASIIASVSAQGEESGRYYEALKWHNDK